MCELASLLLRVPARIWLRPLGGGAAACRVLPPTSFVVPVSGCLSILVRLPLTPPPCFGGGFVVQKVGSANGRGLLPRLRRLHRGRGVC